MGGDRPSWTDMVNQVVIDGRPGDVRHAGALWLQALKDIRSVVTSLETNLKDLDDKWKGGAADAFRGHMKGNTEQLKKLADNAGGKSGNDEHAGIVKALNDAAGHLEDAQSQMPIPMSMQDDVWAARNTRVHLGYGVVEAEFEAQYFKYIVGPVLPWMVDKFRELFTDADEDAAGIYNDVSTDYGQVKEDAPKPVTTTTKPVQDQTAYDPKGSAGGGGGGGVPPMGGGGGVDPSKFGGGVDPSTVPAVDTGSGYEPPGTGDLGDSGLGDVGSGGGGLDDLPGSGLAGAGGGLGAGGGGVSGLTPGAGLGGGGLGAGGGGLGAGGAGLGKGIPGGGALGKGIMPGGIAPMGGAGAGKGGAARGGGRGGALGKGGLPGGVAGMGGAGAGRGGAAGRGAGGAGRGAATGRGAGFMGGAPGGGRHLDGEEDHSTWLQEEDDVWGTDSDAAPPVLG